jgi:hypothetical protein
MSILLTTCFVFVVPGDQKSEKHKQVKSMSKDDFFARLNTLLNARPFTPNKVGSIVSVQLNKHNDESNDFFAVYVGSGNELFKKIELRIPLQPKGDQDGLLILTLAPFVDIELEDVLNRFGRNPDLSTPDPRAPRHAPMYYSYFLKGEKISFGVDRENPTKIVSVVVDRTEPKG